MPRIPRVTDRRTEYIRRFDAELRRYLRTRRETHIDDIVQTEIVRLLDRFGEVTAANPDPARYARTRASSARAQHYRTDNGQRGAGVRFRRDTDGKVVAGREVCSGEAPIGESGISLFDTVADRGIDVEDGVVSSDEATRMLEAARIGAGDLAGECMRLTGVHGMSDVEVGRRLGLARETVNRRKRNAVRAVQGYLSAAVVE